MPTQPKHSKGFSHFVATRIALNTGLLNVAAQAAVESELGVNGEPGMGIAAWHERFHASPGAMTEMMLEVQPLIIWIT